MENEKKKMETRKDLRLPADICLQLSEWAKRENRSFNGHLLWIIKKALAEEDARKQ